jgi:hypothetical protein
MEQLARLEASTGSRSSAMTSTCHQETGPDQPMVYQIRLKGQLETHWSDWFGGMAVALTGDGDTLLTGPVADQAALHGLLRKVRDVGIPLVSVNELKGANP